MNTFSFMLLSGSVVVLCAMMLGASGTYIGLLGALNFITYFFMPLGRLAIRNQPIIKVFGWSWLIRYWSMVPAALSPLLMLAGWNRLGLALLLIGSLGFNIFRGIGLIGNNPLLAHLAGKKNRGQFFSNIQIANSLTAIAASAASVAALRWIRDGWAFGAMFSVAIVTGMLASFILLSMPEPHDYRPAAGTSMAATIRSALADRKLRAFIGVFLPMSFAAGTVRTFIITHARMLYGQSDSLIMVYTLCFNLGTVLMGFMTRKLMDRLGAKPLYFLFVTGTLLTMVPLLVSPLLANGLPLVAFLALVNFAVGFAVTGQENAGQTYFFSLTSPKQTMDLAVVYFMVMGLGGALGSLTGGFFLDGMQSIGLPAQTSYRLLFGAISLLLSATLLGLARLPGLGATPLRRSLSVLFSMRDLRAIDLLEKLDRSHNPEEACQLIRAIGNSGSPVAEKELLPYLSSPRFIVRIEALVALENLEKLSSAGLTALHGELRRHPGSTAYLAARILGKHAYAPALPDLRLALQADDSMLRSAAMIALASLGDEASRSVIEQLLAENPTARIMLSAASALEILGNPASVTALIAVLKKSDPPPFAFDEIVLSLAGLLSGMKGFYQLYSDWCHDAEETMQDMLEKLKGLPGGSERLSQALRNFVASGQDCGIIGRYIAESSRLETGLVTVLAEAAVDDELNRHAGFRLLLAACALQAVWAAGR
ncbi:MAG: hypothetical protein A2087_09630 [Spirochaetes bacterium GWD1_61_31]|nr:MAG: hypothetical protein A2Y37_05280 [Spirochaetes bacterium GWB1_60_80]OHD37785.1 MAG: hypothetical protein A2087_09630 [Spirochaetes bacterium GWD1_61_31]OHD42744.1 MAG: hypothetical protein A2Y35_05660 [Spirochaetes bacterium GWE1_60_18]OHD58595.1 MAG: hypothetical protein A2Y32_04580 [Spirochaetes bacterium GWF1_60_12]